MALYLFACNMEIRILSKQRIYLIFTLFFRKIDFAVQLSFTNTLVDA